MTRKKTAAKGEQPAFLSPQLAEIAAYWRKHAQPMPQARPCEPADLERLKEIADVIDGALLLGWPDTWAAIERMHSALHDIDGREGKRRHVLRIVAWYTHVHSLTDGWEKPQRIAATELIRELARAEPAFGKLTPGMVIDVLNRRDPRATAPKIAAMLTVRCRAFGDYIEDKSRQKYAQVRSKKKRSVSE